MPKAKATTDAQTATPVLLPPVLAASEPPESLIAHVYRWRPTCARVVIEHVTGRGTRTKIGAFSLPDDDLPAPSDVAARAHRIACERVAEEGHDLEFSLAMYVRTGDDDAAPVTARRKYWQVAADGGSADLDDGGGIGTGDAATVSDRTLRLMLGEVGRCHTLIRGMADSAMKGMARSHERYFDSIEALGASMDHKAARESEAAAAVQREERKSSILKQGAGMFQTIVSGEKNKGTAATATPKTVPSPWVRFWALLREDQREQALEILGDDALALSVAPDTAAMREGIEALGEGRVMALFQLLDADQAADVQAWS